MAVAAARYREVPHLVAAGRVSFIVPAHNEEATIAQVLERLVALDLDMQVIVVDDGSTDRTAEIAERFALEYPRTVVIRQARGGKGSAIRAAIPYVNGQIAVVQDADLEYDPVDVPALVEPILSGVADVVYGSRFAGGRPQRVHMFWQRFGNRFLSLLARLLFNTTLTDVETGYKAVRVDVLRSLDLRRSSFDIEIEFTAKVCRRKLRIYEIPIAYHGRTYAEGKKITWRDGFVALAVLLAERLRIERKPRTVGTLPETVVVRPAAAVVSRVI